MFSSPLGPFHWLPLPPTLTLCYLFSSQSHPMSLSEMVIEREFGHIVKQNNIGRIERFK